MLKLTQPKTRNNQQHTLSFEIVSRNVVTFVADISPMH